MISPNELYRAFEDCEGPLPEGASLVVGSRMVRVHQRSDITIEISDRIYSVPAPRGGVWSDADADSDGDEEGDDEMDDDEMPQSSRARSTS